MKSINLILGSSIIAFCLIVSSACISTTSITTIAPTPSSSTVNTMSTLLTYSALAYTVSLSSVNIGEAIRFDMELQDSKSNSVTLDGHLSIKIYDESSPPVLVYQQTFDITSSQFINYTGGGSASYYLTLNPPIKVFEWTSPLTEFITSTHGTTGNASLTFTTTDGKTYTCNTSVLGIPSSSSST